MGRCQYRINLLNQEKMELEAIIRKQTTPQHIARRARIVLLANGEAKTNRYIANQVGMNPCDITLWTKRWIEKSDKPVKERLCDAPRSGTPDRITAEQWCKIIAMACEPPEKYGIPITHWSYSELAKQAIKQDIVETISASHIGNVLKKKVLQPHRCRCWLNAKA